MKTKVIEFIGDYGDGGAESLVRDYALMLDKDLFDVTVVCYYSNKKSANHKILIENNVKLIELYGRINYIDRALARLLGKKYIANKFKKVLKEIKPDVIHTHLELLETLYYSKEELNNVKLFFTCHNLPEMLIGDQRPKEKKACEYLIEHNNLRIIALHDDMRKQINSMFNISNTEVIRNGINFERFSNILETKEEIKESLNIDPNSYLIGNVGRFTYQKNQEFTINIFNEILKIKDNARLLLIGTGKDRDKIEKQIDDLGIKDKVTILSNRKDMPRMFKGMDVFIFPSRFEGLPISLIEVQLVGTPCVVSNNINKETFVSDKITCLSLEDDTKKWVDSCINPSTNLDSYGNINDFDMKVAIKKLEDLYLS